VGCCFVDVWYILLNDEIHCVILFHGGCPLGTAYFQVPSDDNFASPLLASDELSERCRTYCQLRPVCKYTVFETITAGVIIPGVLSQNAFQEVLFEFGRSLVVFYPSYQLSCQVF
jgi:hypothetical protein